MCGTISCRYLRGSRRVFSARCRNLGQYDEYDASMTGNWRARIRSICAILAAALLGWYLSVAGWPWWAWLPATMLLAMSVYMVFVLSWFLYRKLSYRHFARRAKRRHRAAED